MLGYFLSRHHILVLIHLDNRIDDVVQLVKDVIFLLHVFSSSGLHFDVSQGEMNWTNFHYNCE